MATISHEPVTRPERRSPWVAVLSITQMWASLAIAVIWVAVLFSAIYAPDMVSRSAADNSTTIPSVVAVAMFAAIATWTIAKHGFKHDD